MEHTLEANLKQQKMCFTFLMIILNVMAHVNAFTLCFVLSFLEEREAFYFKYICTYVFAGTDERPEVLFSQVNNKTILQNFVRFK